ncbi:MAG TPA: MBL fold metallo-hydrolase, partial [Actinomycetota bacterium]|nr:MBL fold metallo-hydrolase [Actinomycetota bacterium]
GAANYALEAADLGLAIRHVFETHVHADYVSAARELAADNDAELHLHESAADVVTYDFVPVSDGRPVPIGNVVLEPVHTPGHTPEHASYLVTDTTRADEPWCVLTGDSLLVADVGRPDLSLDDAADRSPEDRARTLFRSITGKLFALGAETEIFPAHFGGSRCGGANLSGKASSTIGFERRFNLALNGQTEESFVEHVMNTLRPEPDDNRRIKAINAGREVVRAGS